MNINHLLLQLGFSKNGGKVYLAALEVGLASAQQIARAAGVRRTTAYSVLAELVDRGVIGQSKVRGKLRFLTEPPDKLLALVAHTHTQLKEALPQLEARYNAKNVKPKITFYEGAEAIQNVYDDTLREQPAQILEWNTNAYFERFPKNHNYIDKRVKLGIKARRMAGEGSVWHVKNQKYDSIELSETLIVPKEHLWPAIEVNIYNNKVAFLNYAENMSVIIESPAIANCMRQVYELSWRGAQTLAIKPEKN
jgi:predicted transcriptional regulator